MNILEKIEFNSEEPAVLPLRKTTKTNVLSVGLLKNQTLESHKTHSPTLLIVLKGKIQFQIADKEFEFSVHDTYPIPANIMHEVMGLESENVFILIIDNKNQ